MTVLVLTEPYDMTADLVIAELHQRGVRVHRADTGDFPEKLAVAAAIGGHGQWTGTLTDAYRETGLGDITAVYYRRPGRFRFAPDLDQYERRWAELEARLGFGGVVSSLPCRWVSHPHHIAAAEYKPRQLAAAAGLGLAVPPTLITNDPDAARTFALAAPEGVVYKPLHMGPYVDTDSGSLMALPTTPVSAADITDAVRGTAHLIQHWVPKGYEVRATIVGRHVYAVRIDAGSDAARIDWRTDYAALTYTPITLPDPVADRLVLLVDTLSLRFGAVDLVITPDDQYVFLEINPNGQWHWIAEEAELPIAAAIADELEPR